jgi:hypothetical protein
MLEFNRHSFGERKLPDEQLQTMLADCGAWLRRLIDDKRDLDEPEAVVITPATTQLLRNANRSGSLTVYDFIDTFHIEFGEYDSDEQQLTMTHYLLRQDLRGTWRLQTTGDLDRSPELMLEQLEWRGYQLSDNESDRLGKGEPLYPELLRKANQNEVEDFHERVELGAFGDASLDFKGLLKFLKDTDAIVRDIERLSKNNPD